MDSRSHWETVYRTKAAEEVSWYQPSAARSLALIRHVAPQLDAPIIDVGGGASVLVDGLLGAGYRDVTVLDLSTQALDAARQRLGPLAAGVSWRDADIRTVELPAAHYGVWHDRAVFHFLTDPADRAAYVARVQSAVRVGGHVIVATFAEDGPTRCSGLPVMPYSAEGLHDAFGPAFELLASEREKHITPTGGLQTFVYCLCRWEGAPRT